MTATVPVLVSRERMSVLPSPLKSPMPATTQLLGTGPRPTDSHGRSIHLPNRYVRRTCCARECRRWSTPMILQFGGGTVPRFTVDEMAASIHKPDRQVAGIILPEKSPMPSPFMSPVPIDVPSGWHVADSGRRGHRQPIHEPHVDVAIGVPPQQVSVAVAIEVALADDRVRAGYGCDVAEPKIGCRSSATRHGITRGLSSLLLGRRSGNKR